MKKSNFRGWRANIRLFVLLSLLITAFITIEYVVRASNTMPVVIGDYANVTVQLSGNTTVIPTVLPVNVASITGVTSSEFNGQISVDLTSGIVQITNAHPVGNYPISIKVFDNNGAAVTKSFVLSVVQVSPSCDQTDFKQAPTFDSALAPNAITVEDFDGDGKQDIATVGSGVSITRNISTNGNINFASKVDLNSSSGGLGIATADFDGDNKKDIVTANFSTPNVSVLRNTNSSAGTISFAPKVDFAVGSNPRSVAIADFDQDGKQDIIVANSGSNNISVLRNLSSGAGTISFDTAINIAVQSEPRSVAVGDFNGDGRPDIAIANYSSFNVTVLVNTTSSQAPITFNSSSILPIGSPHDPTSLIVADFNSDGKSDIATANFLTGQISVFRNTSNTAGMSFGSRVNFKVGFGPYSIITKDFDGDGKPDLATANYYGNTVTILRNNTTVLEFISFEFRREFGVRQTPTGIAAGDFDNNGKLDLTISNAKSNNISVLRNTSTGAATMQFDARAEYGLSGNPYSIALGDFDKDGKQDLVASNLTSSRISVLRNLGTTIGVVKFSPSVDFALGANSSPYSIAVQDFDGDGRQDVVTNNRVTNIVTVLRNTSTAPGTISFALGVDFAVGASPEYIGIGDFDGDGKYDIATVNRGSNNVSVLRNTSSKAGTISFAARADFAVNSGSSSLAVGDFDGDNKPDIAVTNFGGTTVSVLRNLSTEAGNVSFTPKVDFAVNSNPYSIAIADFDGDGKIDLAVTNVLDNKYVVSALRNTSSGLGNIGFALSGNFIIDSPENSILLGRVVTGDIDNNGKPDILVTNGSTYSLITLLKNNSNAAGTISFLPKIDSDTSTYTSSLAVGDFDGDGKQDVAFSSYNSNNVGILQNPCTVAGSNQFDFDGDGKSDISVFRPDNGAWYLNQSSNGFIGTQFGLGTDVIAPADYDGDGKTDVAVFRPETGNWYLQQSANGFLGVQFGQKGDIPVPADYDGDGKADIAVYRPSTGGWYRLNSSTGQFFGVSFGASEDKPTIGDFDGDGKADVAVYRPSTGSWYRLNSSNGQFVGVPFGMATDKPVPADYDGDGKTDIAVYRDGNWYLLQSTNGFAGFQFGVATDLPVPADYDGDGKADAAVFRDGNWYLLQSTNGFTGVQFGNSTDKPIPNAFVP